MMDNGSLNQYVDTNAQQSSTSEATKAATSAKREEFKAAADAAYASMTEAEKAQAGSKSNTIKFINTIGHAGIKVTRSVGSESQPSNKTIGYRLKNVGDAPISVPVAPYDSTSVTTANISDATRLVQPGEEFVVNLVEAGILVSQVEYSGKFTGDGVEARFSPKMQKDGTLPLVTFKVVGGSSKDGMVTIGGDKNADGTVILTPEYETSFRALFVKKVKPPKQPKAENNTAARQAALYRGLIAQKKQTM